MSDFTTQLRFICESYAGRTEEGSEAKDVDSIIALARPQLFNFDYPIFDEAYRPELETKIINHFYTQEIGQETVGLFKQRLKTKMREIMPYYNQFYLSEKLKFDPFKNADYVDLHNQSAEGSKDSTNSNTSGFNTSTVNDVDNTHNDDTSSTSSGTTHRNGTGGDTKDTTGASTDAEHSDTSSNSTQNNTDTGSKSDTSTHTLAANVSTLTKEADTPLGSISASTAVGNNNGYLSKVTETIQNNGGTGKQESTDNTTSETKTGSSVVDSDGSSNTTKSGTSNSSEVGTNQFDEDGTSTDVGETSTAGGYHTDNDTVTAGDSTSDTVGTENSKSKQDYFGKVFGKVGSETYSEMLNKFRATFLNIDMDVIHELEPLFMLIW